MQSLSIMECSVGTSICGDLYVDIVTDGEEPFEFLKHQSEMGLRIKYGESWNDNIDRRERWEYEINKINDCEMTDFYLVLWDLVNYAKSNDIWLSPGCGAIPGSLVAYSLDITDVDPIKYNLLMDRFLSQKREFRTGCRIEVEIGGSKRFTNYLIEKYGEGSLEFLERLDITFQDLDEVSIIRETLKNISGNTSQSVDFSMINYDDMGVFDLINSDGIRDTKFLREILNDSVAKGIEVKSMEDMIARLSLNRPGLEERCAEYVKNKNNPDFIHYECPALESILAPTYGCIVYHEQIMQILISIGGFSPEESDLTCRSMSKRKMIFNETARHDFIKGNVDKGISGCAAIGISEPIATKIFDDMWTAAIYGFSKAHAAAYATLIYRMAWLKYYYREEYLAAVTSIKKSFKR